MRDFMVLFSSGVGKMTARVAHDVLRRMASPPPPAPEDVPTTSSRAIRMAVTRAADRTHDMSWSVKSLREEILSLDGLLEALDPSLMLMSMMMAGRIRGLVALDLNLRTALVEAQTIGHALEKAPEERAPTGTDAQMSLPLINAFLDHLKQAAGHTPLDGWVDGYEVGYRIDSMRAAGLILDEGRYRLIRVSLDLGVGDRQAELVLTLPHKEEVISEVAKPEVVGSWEARFKAIVDGSPATLDAVLHRFSIPLHQAENLSVGQVLPLPGCTVSSVKLIAKDGRKVATARLGQSGGMRAVRIEAAPHLQMDDMGRLVSKAALADDVSDGMGDTLDAAPTEPQSIDPDVKAAKGASPESVGN